MYSFVTSPSFRSQASIISPPVQRKNQGEIFKEDIKEQAIEARKKDASERTVDDYMAIGINTMNNLVDNAPVVYANESNKLNYLA